MLGTALPPQRALEIGLATEVVAEGEAVQAARALAERMLSFAPLALGVAKLVLNTCSDVDAETGRRLERLGQSVLKTTRDHSEGASAFIEKRPARWEGR